MTEWRRIRTQLYRSYEVSSDGDVRRNGRPLVGYVDRYGYRTVLLSYAGLSKRYKVHRLVCEAFHGPCPEGRECAHLDGNNSNNRPENLAWVTRSENTKHQVLHGTFAGTANLVSGHPPGETHPGARLSDQTVSAIRADAAAGLGGRRLSSKYGISRSHAYRLVTRQQRNDTGDAPCR
jgi:hypothetical protein